MDTEKPPKRLPVIATAIEAIRLPLIHWREFMRFGGITLGVVFLRQLILQVPSPNNPQISPVRAILGILLAQISVIVLVPYQVAWIKLTLNGADSVASRQIWTFGRVEIKFILGLLVLAVISGGPCAVAIILALLLSNIMPLMILSLLAAAGLLIAGIGCTVRLWFVLIELAIERYNGASAAWNQSRGMVWRLSALGLLAPLPFLIGMAICGFIQVKAVTDAGWVMFALLGSLFDVLTSAPVAGGLALAYRQTAPEVETAAIALN